MNILKGLFTKLYKKPSKKDEDPIVTYFNMGITENENLLIDGGFIDEHDEFASKLVFLLCSGAIHDIVIEWIVRKCGDDEERASKILEDAYTMINESFSDDDGEDEPVVDPCQVFKQNKQNSEQIEELEQ